MVFHHVLPLALPGILTGTILGLARALGETAPLLLIGMVAFVANYPATPKPGDAPPTFPKLDVPLLVIHGMKDTALLSFGHNDTWDQNNKDTTILMIPESGHWIQRDAPDLLAAQVRSWLEMHPTK